MYKNQYQKNQMQVYVRQRTVKNNSFLEYYLTFAESLQFPTAPLERFETRIVSKFSLAACLGPDVTKGFYTAFKEFNETKNLYTPESIWLSIKFVTSKAPEKAILRTKNDIERDGVWATFSDCVPRGGSPDIAGHEEHMALLESCGKFNALASESWPTVEHRATFMGIPMHSMIYRLLYAHIDEIYEMARASGLDVSKESDPRVVYHGTSQESLKSILSHGLRTTYGMFGPAVYFGTFWKASRFAYMTQDYQKRPGSILRCLAFWPKPALWSIRSDRCLCAQCYGLKGHADHLGLWKEKSNWVLAYPEIGGPIKNEEYAAVDDSKIFIDIIGSIVCTSENHEPWLRTQCIS